MGKYNNQQLSELFSRAKKEKDAVLDAVVRNKLWVNDVVREMEQFINVHALSIVKGALGIRPFRSHYNSDYDAPEPPLHISQIWEQIQGLDKL